MATLPAAAIGFRLTLLIPRDWLSDELQKNFRNSSSRKLLSCLRFMTLFEFFRKKLLAGILQAHQTAL